jgi:hypothetical protein
MTTTTKTTTFTQYTIDGYLVDIGLDPTQETYQRLEQVVVPLIPETLAAGASYKREGNWMVVSHGTRSVELSIGVRDGLAVIHIDRYGVEGQPVQELRAAPYVVPIKVHPTHLDAVLCYMLGITVEVA